MGWRRFSSASIVVMSILFTVRASAGDAPDATPSADALFRSAKEAAAHGDLATACAQFAESERLDHAVGTLLNLADCEERRGTLAIALEHLRAVRDELKPGDFRVAFTDQRIDALAGRVPRLTVRLPSAAPANARVLRDNLELRPASLGVALPVDPGPHACVLRVPGRADVRVDVTLAEGERRVVELKPAAALAGAPPSRDEAEGSAGTGSNGRRTLGWSLGGAGVAALGIGVVTGLVTANAASTTKNHCNASSECDGQGLDAASTGRTMSIVSPIAFAVGIAAVGVGAYLLLTIPKTEAKVALAPRLDAKSAGIGLGADF